MPLPKITGRQATVAVIAIVVVSLGVGALQRSWPDLPPIEGAELIARAEAQQKPDLSSQTAANAAAIVDLRGAVSNIQHDVGEIKGAINSINARLPSGPTTSTQAVVTGSEGTTQPAEVAATTRPVIYPGREINWAGRPYKAGNFRLGDPGNVQSQREQVRHTFGIKMAEAYTLLCGDLSILAGADVCGEIDRGSPVGGYNITEQEVQRYRYLLRQFTQLVDFVDSDAKTGSTGDKRHDQKHEELKTSILASIEELQKKIRNHTFRIDHLVDVVGYIWAALYGDQVVPLWIEYDQSPALTPANAVKYYLAELDGAGNTVRIGQQFGGYITDVNSRRGNALNMFFVRPEPDKSGFLGRSSLWGIINVANGDASQIITGGELPLITAKDVSGKDRKGRLLFATRLRSPCGGGEAEILACHREDLITSGVRPDIVELYFKVMRDPK